MLVAILVGNNLPASFPQPKVSKQYRENHKRNVVFLQQGKSAGECYFPIAVHTSSEGRGYVEISQRDRKNLEKRKEST
jgi:hypothetical protein